MARCVECYFMKKKISQVSVQNLKLYVLDHFIGRWSGANTWMHIMIWFLAWGSSLGHNNWKRGIILKKIYFLVKVTKVYLILCGDLEEHLCNFWLKNKYETFFCAFSILLPQGRPSCQKFPHFVNPCFAPDHPPM